MIDRGSPVPSVQVKLIGADGATDTTSDAVLGTGLVVFFAVPGAFTPTEIVTAWQASLTVLVLRVGFSYILGNVMDLQVRGIWYAMYLDWIGRSIFFIWRFRSDKWLGHHLV